MWALQGKSSSSSGRSPWQDRAVLEGCDVARHTASGRCWSQGGEVKERVARLEGGGNESERLWWHQHQQPGEEAALGWRFCQWWTGARRCPLPGRENQDSGFLQEDFVHSSLLKRFWGWAAGAVATITGTEVGGPDCISLPAVAKFHQRPGAGPAALPSCGTCHITQSLVRWAGKGGMMGKVF